MSTVAAIATSDMRIFPGGTCVGDPDQMTDDLVDRTRNDLDTASDPSAAPKQRAAAHKRLVPFMAIDDHERLHRSLAPRAWKAAGIPGRLVRRGPERRSKAAATRHAAGTRRKAAASSSSGGDDGPPSPSAAKRAAHPRPAHPPTARRGDLLQVGDYLSATLARQIGGAR